LTVRHLFDTLSDMANQIKSARLALRIPADLAKAVARRQAALKTTKSAVIVMALRAYLTPAKQLGER
jgi:hypothetical protein